MAVSLLGLMAVGMFFIIMIIIGLCANRCLSRQDDDSLVQDSDGIKDAAAAHCEAKHPREAIEGILKPARTETSGEVELAELLRPRLNASVSYSDTRFADDQRCRYERESPIISTQINLPTALHSLAQPNQVLPSIAFPEQAYVIADKPHVIRVPQRELQQYPTQVVSSRSSSDNSATPTKLPVGGRFLLAERNIGVILGSLSILGGLLFTRQLYSEGYTTILDPFQLAYGRRVVVLMSVPIILAEGLSAVCVLSSLATLTEIVLGISKVFGAVISLVTVICYLLFGGLYAGIFTDAVQFVYMCIGLWIFFPVALSRASEPLSSTFPKWVGKVEGRQTGQFIDQFVMLVLGGIPMQSYFQRILASRNSRGPRVVTVVGSVGCLLNAIPAIFVGATATTTDWNSTSYGKAMEAADATNILHLSLSILVPTGIAFLCVGALASGLISTCDSAIISTATIIAHNVYKCWLKPAATEKELIWMARLVIFGLSICILIFCLVFQQAHQVWLLPFDILYVLVFPQLFCVIYFKYANTFGAVAGLSVGVVLRLLSGIQQLNLQPILHLPFYDSYTGQLFPYRTFAMFSNLLTIIIVSLVSHLLYHRGIIATSPQNILACFGDRQFSLNITERRSLAATATIAYIRSNHHDSLESDVNAMERMTVV